MLGRVATCVAARRRVGHGVLTLPIDEVGIAEQLAVCPSEAIGEMQEVGVTQRLDPRHLAAHVVPPSVVVHLLVDRFGGVGEEQEACVGAILGVVDRLVAAAGDGERQRAAATVQLAADVELGGGRQRVAVHTGARSGGVHRVEAPAEGMGQLLRVGVGRAIGELRAEDDLRQRVRLPLQVQVEAHVSRPGVGGALGVVERGAIAGQDVLPVGLGPRLVVRTGEPDVAPDGQILH